MMVMLACLFYSNPASAFETRLSSYEGTTGCTHFAEEAHATRTKLHETHVGGVMLCAAFFIRSRKQKQTGIVMADPYV
jgi:hypothetical protein